ncbi:LysR family transcriptional regulator [Sphingomonas oryzagri]|jgi:DNA-binding transcriptional LysR family regulator|uniref:LysR family transcriptional regulator n=1 Tax=Sphingomonas oryzagri TaxID=3042314 RepID=A0ABT6MX90_9SPHN|nr:LysR family transcriptional regulator [Sphingomonas oryzagri]MDH7637660.1 LysR family transcriptional regulator [Sphingomonas oryzagri]
MLDAQSLVTIFLASVDTGSFAAAGRKLNLSRSSVGKAIGRLEDDLGVRLFHRSTRQLGLSEDGHIFLEHAKRAQAELEVAKQIFASSREVPAGVLRVSAPSALGRHAIGPLLMDMVSRYPDLKLSLSLTDRPIDLIDEGYDMSIRIGASLDTIGIVGRKIGMQRMGLYAAPAYLVAHGVPSRVDELEEHQMLVYSKERSLRWRMSTDAPAVRGLITGVGKARFDDFDLLADSAIRGHGIASLPHWLAGPHVVSGALVEPLTIPCRAYDIMALWPQSEFLPARTRAAIDHLAQALPPFLAERIAA